MLLLTSSTDARTLENLCLSTTVVYTYYLIIIFLSFLLEIPGRWLSGRSARRIYLLFLQYIIHVVTLDQLILLPFSPH
ncbi:hypothetical protein BT96DRAFT_332171 [Gymnopus androsaceus JB14]|uniref:Uncharacterized protein n=1 Tax=Gymnopus androsaceus JB14 TaxID=1447944 RepID=A0A6A4GY62_9AGAR|nr:hypothetical protein BT96DRAFT_332171 [Gymnopus androsaceus JB14]